MAATKEIRQRIKSVGNIRKITKAMEMVAAAKMKRSQTLALRSQKYSQEALKTLAILGSLEENSHPFLQENPTATKTLLVVITSDRGLSGSYNSSIIKLASQYISSSQLPVDIITVGKRGQDFFKQTEVNIVATFTNLPTYPNLNDLEKIIAVIRDDFFKGTYKNVTLIYTQFHSTIKTTAKAQPLLPVTSTQDENYISAQDYIFEPNHKLVLDVVVPRLVEVLFYQYMLESIASEYSNQMIAMKNASDNAKDIIDDLQILYNTLRQASITQELAEITSGAAALE